MKIVDLQPTAENILDTYSDDAIGRNGDIFRFVNMLNSINRPFSVAVDAPWGAGKTFFVKQAKLVLDAFNPHTKCLEQIEADLVQNAWRRNKGADKVDFQPQVTVYYDAWRNDNDTDPIHSLVYAILQTIESDFKFRESSGLIRLAAGFVDAFQGTSISNLLDLLHGEDPLAAIGAQKKVEQQFAEFLESLLAERGNRLVVFVDELDRCNPSFAVKLLERIKHYFFNDRITFVFSININELQHTIRKHYGMDFDACRYLDRFFDFRLSLPPVDMDAYFRNAGLAHGHYVYDGICKSLIDIYGFTFRESTKFLQTAFAAAYKPTHDEKKRFIFSDGRGEFFCIAAIVPLLIALRIKDYARYNNFVSGDDSTPLHELFNFSNSVSGLKSDLLADNETYRTAGEAGAGTAVSLTEKLNQVYDAVFVNPYINGNYETEIGKCSFSKNTRDLVFHISSAMSEYADFTI